MIRFIRAVFWGGLDVTDEERPRSDVFCVGVSAICGDDDARFSQKRREAGDRAMRLFHCGDLGCGNSPRPL